ncbi:MAG: glutathione S-transferase family protein [Woeseia sp.]
MHEHICIHGDSRSGNCYKLQLLCAELGLDYDWREVDILAGETHTKDFLQMNPNGKIPLLVVDNDYCLPESNAIMSYLADGNSLVGTDRRSRADVLSWMFFEQYSHEPYVGTARFIVKYLGNPLERRQTLEEKQQGGYRALNILEQQLSTRDFITGSDFSLADIALFAYTHVADEGGFDLSTYAAINAWFERIRSRPAFVPMGAPAN